MVHECPKCFEQKQTQEDYARHMVVHYGGVAKPELHEMTTNMPDEVAKYRLEYGGIYHRPLESMLGTKITRPKKSKLDSAVLNAMLMAAAVG